jgi:hypothetical protein
MDFHEMEVEDQYECLSDISDESLDDHDRAKTFF